MKSHTLILILLFIVAVVFSAAAQDCTLTTPTNLIVSDISGCSVTLHWKMVQNASSYKVKYRESTSAQWSAPISCGDDTLYTFNNLVPNTKYVLAVRATCSNGTKSKFSL